MTLHWIRAEGETAFVAITAKKTYRVKWLSDIHAWIYNGKAFEHVDMAKGAAQTEYLIAGLRSRHTQRG